MEREKRDMLKKMLEVAEDERGKIYDCWDSCYIPEWAKETLNRHVDDPEGMLKSGVCPYSVDELKEQYKLARQSFENLDHSINNSYKNYWVNAI